MEQKQRILVVDDLPSNIKTLNEILRSHYNISVATSGRDALKIVARDRPDLILLDIMMPEMDGYEVCQALKGDHATSDIPVIFVTAMGEVEDETRGLELGAVDYITKPVSPPLVLARVRNHLQLKLQRDQLKTSISVLQHEAEILQQKAELGIQAGGLAHDLNNVLAGAMIIEVIPDMVPAEDENKQSIVEFVGHAVESLKLGREICQGYTCYLRDIGEEEKEQSVMPLLQPLDMYSRKFRGELRHELQQDVPAIRCKGYQIKRVLVNLFTNACQAIEGVSAPVITISIWSENERVFISMMDNGPGIPSEVLPQIFAERFTTKATGTGLGLFMVENIVKAHQGTIMVTSGEGEGTTFTLSFPAVLA